MLNPYDVAKSFISLELYWGSLSPQSVECHVSGKFRISHYIACKMKDFRLRCMSSILCHASRVAVCP